MIWADLAILTILAISALISIWRGFLREVLSLAAWVAAFWVALSFTHPAAGLLLDYVSVPTVRLVLTFLGLFMGTLLVVAVFNHLMLRLMVKTGLSGTDRMLGVFFGLARGVAVVTVLVLLAGLTPLPQDPWWRESMLIGHFQSLALWMRTYLPEDLAGHFSF